MAAKLVVRAIIFDYGNVLERFDNERFLRAMDKHSKLGVDQLRRVVYETSGLPRKFETGEISPSEFYQRMCKVCLSLMKQGAFRDIYVNKFAPILETQALIPKLAAKYSLALLSNTSTWDFKNGIKKMPIFRYFKAVSLSYEVKAMKPDQRIWQDCLSKLRLSAQECVYLDDIAGYVGAAREMGMYGIHVTTPQSVVDGLKDVGVEID